MAPFEALYGRRCRAHLCWSDQDEVLILGLDLISETAEMIRKIQEHIRTTQSCQKSNIGKRRPLEFNVGDKIFLKVSPTKCIKGFGVQAKLRPRYIGPYKIIKKLNPTAYRLDLLVYLEHEHYVFHISQLRKYVPNADNAIVAEPIAITENLAYEGHLIQY